MRGTDGRLRCAWAAHDPDYRRYHDTEWGRPVFDELRLFEKLCLEGFQAGLSWLLILRKRPAFRTAFHGFDPDAVAAMGPADVERLLADASIVRNRRKITATIDNARALLALREHGAALPDLVWQHAPPAQPRPRHPDEIPSATDASRALSAALREQGFRFVGPVTCYALMQALGLVDDHLHGCSVPPSATGPAAARR